MRDEDDAYEVKMDRGQMAAADARDLSREVVGLRLRLSETGRALALLRVACRSALVVKSPVGVLEARALLDKLDWHPNAVEAVANLTTGAETATARLEDRSVTFERWVDEPMLPDGVLSEEGRLQALGSARVTADEAQWLETCGVRS